VNGDFVALDGFQGGVQTIGLGSSPVTLTVPAGFTATPSAGPTQAQNAVLRLTGVLTSAVTITLPMPGYYIVENLTTGAFVVTLRAVTATQVIGIDQGMCQHIYNDGANVRFVNLPQIGSYLDLAVSTVPAWISSCTVPPYLLCDGSVFSAVTYPVLNTKLGGTTLPDARGRARYALDGGTNRVTSAGSGVAGNTILTGGGDQLSQAHAHTNSISDPGHNHIQQAQTLYNANGPAVGGGTGAFQNAVPGTVTSTSTTGIGVTVNSNLSGGSQNMPPLYVGGITLIRAG